jgi:ADP-ribose pyrophosphatase YjhB (NUDIX family)
MEGKRIPVDMKKHRVCCADCVIVRGNRVLLQKRSFGIWKGYWCLPGGKVNRGETIIGAAVRETKEESGLDLKGIQMLGIYDGKDRDPEQDGISIGFLCEASEEEPRISREATEMKFFPLNRLPEKMAFDHRLVVEDAKKAIVRDEKDPIASPRRSFPCFCSA